ncbi:hypothetical protein AB0K60_03715 [Thermopolyspora sp. NPDC052614]|uniref:hypothetical protein n=1 Tax=Thermopolyspora sp. NPDC052614 TaxID=3155682 RepID=UPI00342626C0
MKILVRTTVAGISVGAFVALSLVVWKLAISQADDEVKILYHVMVDVRWRQALVAPGVLVVGLLIGGLLRLPLWPVVGLVAPITVIVLFWAEPWFVKEVAEGETVLHFFFLVTVAYVVTAWLCAPGHKVSGVVVAVGMVVAAVAMPLVNHVEGEWLLVQRLKDSGVPLIAPQHPDFRLAGLAESYLPKMLALEYKSTRKDGPSLEVYVKPGEAVTSGTACAAWREGETDVVISCRRTDSDVWVAHLEGGDVLVSARSGDAVVQMASWDMTRAELVAVLRTFRSVAAERLVALV